VDCLIQVQNGGQAETRHQGGEGMADQVRVFVSHHHSPEEDAFTARLVAGLEAAGGDFGCRAGLALHLTIAFFGD
jgi:hypothetical protein